MSILQKLNVNNHLYELFIPPNFYSSSLLPSPENSLNVILKFAKQILQKGCLDTSLEKTSAPMIPGLNLMCYKLKTEYVLCFLVENIHIISRSLIA